MSVVKQKHLILQKEKTDAQKTMSLYPTSGAEVPMMEGQCFPVNFWNVNVNRADVESSTVSSSTGSPQKKRMSASHAQMPTTASVINADVKRMAGCDVQDLLKPFKVIQ
jgi:hypothetical protein